MAELSHFRLSGAQSLAPRRYALDVVRGLAVLIVLGRHHPIPAKYAGSLEPVAKIWFRFGWTAVDLFFVLSGFLIGGMLFRELKTTGKLNAGRFVVRRIARIWPPYFLYVGFLALGLWFTAGRAPIFTEFQKVPTLIPNLLHIQNYVLSIRPHTWSLAIEEHFYIALPLALLLFVAWCRPPVKYIPGFVPTVIVFAAGILGLRLLNSETSNHGDFYSFLFPSHLRVDSIFFGVLLAYLVQFKPEWLTFARNNRLALVCAGLILVSPASWLKIENSTFMQTFGLTLLYLGWGCIVLAAYFTDERPAPGFVESAARFLAGIGIVGYSIYLWHWDIGRNPVKALVERGALAWLPPELAWLAGTIIYVTVAIFGGWILGRLVEIPVIAWRDRLLPARKHDEVASTPPRIVPQAAAVAVPARALAAAE